MMGARAQIAEARRRLERSLHRWRHQVSPEETRRTLARLMGEGVDVLFVHSSLSACGHFKAGPGDILDALSERCGTLGLPTHSYTYPLRDGELAPVFDAATTPSQNGALTELHRKAPSSIRSIHSTHSLALAGPAAANLARHHYTCETPAGAGTPYARMLDSKAAALMWGVTFHSYTFFHTAEDASGSTFAYEPMTRDRLRVVDEEGTVRECVSRRQTRDQRRFSEAGDLLEIVGLARRAELGGGVLRYVPDCSKAHDFLVERLRKVPDFLFANCSKELA